MQTLIIETAIDAPLERSFALVRDPRLHTATIVSHKGDLGIGQIVRFESRLVGIPTSLTLEVTEFDPPTVLTDELCEGIFREFRHRHEFRPAGNGTLMIDTVVWTLPLGRIGMLFDRLVRERLRKVISRRNALLKGLAERD